MSPVADRGDDVASGRVPLEISGLGMLSGGDEIQLTCVIELQLTIHPDFEVCAYGQYTH